MDVARLIHLERIQQRTAEDIVEIWVPQIQEQSLEVIKVIPQERVSIRIVEQAVDLPVLQIMECAVGPY